MGNYTPGQHLTTRDQGKQIENSACRYLENQGLTLLRRNFFCRLGEIDLIMQDKNELVFVEVRYRKSLTYGGSIESITTYKQRTLINTAHYYLKKHNISEDIGCRFDVCAVSYIQNRLKMDWIKDAFQIDY